MSQVINTVVDGGLEQNGVTAATFSEAVPTTYATDDDGPVVNQNPIPQTVTQTAHENDNIFNIFESIYTSIRPILADFGVVGSQPNTTAVNQANALALAQQQAVAQRNMLLFVGAAVVVGFIILRKKG